MYKVKMFYLKSNKFYIFNDKFYILQEGFLIQTAFHRKRPKCLLYRGHS